MKHWSEHLICASHSSDADISNPIFDAENDGATCAVFCSQSRRPDGTVKRTPKPVVEMAPRRVVTPGAMPVLKAPMPMAPKPPTWMGAS